MNLLTRTLSILVCMALGMAANAQDVALVRVIGGFGTGPGEFDQPTSVAVDSEGNILVTDFANDRVQKFDPDGEFIVSWDSSGTGPGQFRRPIDVTVDGADNFYVLDFGNSRVQKFDADGDFVTQWGSSGSANGQFDAPAGITADASGDIWVADRRNHRIQKFSGDGVFIASFGVPGMGDGQLNLPSGIGFAANGDILIADQGNNRVQRFDSDFSFLSTFGTAGIGPGDFDLPSDVVVSDDGRIFVADTHNDRIQVFSPAEAYLGEFGAFGTAPGQFDAPRNIAIFDDQIVVADRNNDRLQQFREVGIGQKISGSWFDESHDGEGWKIEILPTGQAVIYWFTFPPPGEPGEQAWIGGVGRIEGNQIIVEEGDSFIATDGTFGDPDRNATISQWGAFTFTFEDDSNGTMDYSGPAGWGSGSFDIKRLTSVSAAGTSAQTNLGRGISGSWIAREGFASEGWLIEVTGEKSALIYWFTYDEFGNQAWNLGVGTMVANSILVFNPVDASGTVFGAGFNPDNVVRTAWGSYVFTFDDCNNGFITYASKKGLGFSQIPLRRLTTLAGAPCTDFVRTKGEDKPTLGAICTNPDDPTLLISFRDDGHNGLYFGDKTADGLAQSLDKILISPVPGAVGEADTVIDVFDDGMMTMVADVSTGNMVAIETNETNDNIVLTGLGKDGDLQSIVTANLAALFDPDDKRRKSSTVEAGTGGPTRSGPVRVWASELKAGLPQPLPSGSVDAITVSVSRCGAPVTGAAVNTAITSSENSAVKVLLAGRQSSDGVYSIPVPTSEASASRLPDDQQCGGFADQAGSACAMFDRLEDPNFPLLCATTAAGMAEGTATETKLARASEFFISCASALGSGKLACDAAGSQQAAGSQNREDYVCSDAVSADRALDGPLFNLDNVEFETMLSFPGTAIDDFPFRDNNSYPSEGPFPDYVFAFDGDPSIDKFFTTPSAPDARQGYTATVRVGCLPDNAVVDMSVSGSDGFTGFGSCIISGNGECNLNVPPSSQTVVRDTIMVTVPGAEREVQIVF